MTRLIRRAEVEHQTGLSRSSIYRLISSGDFPRPVPISPGGKRWDESEVQSWIQEKVSEARNHR